MRLIDEMYLVAPGYGSRKMTEELKNNGEIVNRKKVQRLMRLMGLEVKYPKPRTTFSNKEHYKYPYLLKNLTITKPNQVWGTDITYIPMEKHFVYLVAIIDLYSRYVLSWEISENLESDFCIKALTAAFKNYGTPKIINSDQGTQYTSIAYTEIVKNHGVSISMSGRGRCWDNIFVERLWRSLKQEEVYLKCYETKVEAVNNINDYFYFYNNRRLHQSLKYKTPAFVYYNQ
jgi:putative transposase